MLLTVNVSDPFLELYRDGQAPVDGVEVGPWFSVAQIEAYRRALPALPFTFHGADLIERVGWVPGAAGKIAAYVRAADSPWASVHLTMWPPGMVGLMLRRKWRLPLPNAERATRRFIRQIGRLARTLAVPIIVENVEPLPFPGYDFEVRPERIGRVLAELAGLAGLAETGCGLVLDTGHACVAAAALDVDVKDYIEALPLGRVRQVHVSGTRVREGRLFDAHEPLREEDYALLDFVLERTRPEMVTLEYIREREALREQLLELRRIVGRET